MEEPLLTLQETAKWLNVSAVTVRKLLRAGELRGKKVGRQWRIPPVAIRKYLEMNNGHREE